jgi:GNAT superfamily N-acetyltransferase
MEVRPATGTETEFLAVMGLLERALLEIDPGTVRRAVEAGDALVAVEEQGRPPAGALVLAGERIAAVAVRPSRRREGIGSALVAAAADRRERLVAECRPELASFYRELGFVVERQGDRCRGVLE